MEHFKDFDDRMFRKYGKEFQANDHYYEKMVKQLRGYEELRDFTIEKMESSQLPKDDPDQQKMEEMLKLLNRYIAEAGPLVEQLGKGTHLAERNRQEDPDSP